MEAATAQTVDGSATEVTEGESHEGHTQAIVPAAPQAGRELSVAPTDVTAADLVLRLNMIQEAMDTAMVVDVDYGRIPGAKKPSLYKPGAEKLAVMFRLDIQTVTSKTWGPGEHLTVEAISTVYDAPTQIRLGNGEGLCTSREKKYGKRLAARTCPVCNVAAIIKGKKEYGGGWVCFKKKDGCGAKFPDGDASIEGQQSGEVDNPELPDTWNTIVKMAKKRAVVDAVLLTTGASALFTQDIEDMAPPPDDPGPPPEPPARTQTAPPKAATGTTLINDAQKAEIKKRLAAAELTKLQELAVVRWWIELKADGLPEFNLLPEAKAGDLIEAIGPNGTGVFTILNHCKASADEGNEAAKRLMAGINSAPPAEPAEAPPQTPPAVPDEVAVFDEGLNGDFSGSAL